MCFDFAWNSLSGLFFCSRCCFSFSLDEINDWIFDWTYGIQYRIRTQVLCGWPAIFGRQSSTFLLCSFTLTFVLVLGLGSFLVFVRTHSHSRTHTFEKGPYCSFDMLFVASKTAPFDAWAKSRLVGALKFFKRKALKRIFRKYYWSRYELRCNHSRSRSGNTSNEIPKNEIENENNFENKDEARATVCVFASLLRMYIDWVSFSRTCE